jgi:hypothetical protein
MELGSLNNLIATLMQNKVYTPDLTVSEGRAILKQLAADKAAKEAGKKK